ncbi:PDR/VanB family oxidoreductase [Azospirillum sp. ST 5-10]|uniref:PDR/VanB family oxidoreductase n=1 Tax=unclassified Azospirillum TaxID=2630922 RepID=UPI003F49EA44
MVAELEGTTAMPLTVRHARWAAEGIRLFELARRDGADLPEFAPGAHVLVRVPNGMVRRYSLSNPPSQRDRYEIAVKREDAGRGGSRSLVDEAAEGDELLVSVPRNDFALKGSPARYLFIAGGIGITPVLSMARHLVETGGKPFKLYYLTRSPETTAFREELAAPEFRGKVVLHHDHGDPGRSLDLWPILEEPKGAHVYCCGPRALMEAVRDMTGHWSAAAVHFEDFGTGQAAHAATDRPFTVHLARSGEDVAVAAEETLLEALRAKGHLVPSSCESGTCGTCRVGLLEGAAEHRDLVLSEHERVRAIMPCVSRACGDRLVLDL